MPGTEEEDSTPIKGIFNYFSRQKRGRSESSSSGKNSQVRKSVKVGDELDPVKMDLLQEFDDTLHEAEDTLSGFDSHIEKCFRDFKHQMREYLETVVG